jgi:hypothetical protein
VSEDYRIFSFIVFSVSYIAVVPPLLAIRTIIQRQLKELQANSQAQVVVLRLRRFQLGTFPVIAGCIGGAVFLSAFCLSMTDVLYSYVTNCAYVYSPVIIVLGDLKMRAKYRKRSRKQRFKAGSLESNSQKINVAGKSASYNKHTLLSELEAYRTNNLPAACVVAGSSGISLAAAKQFHLQNNIDSSWTMVCSKPAMLL